MASELPTVNSAATGAISTSPVMGGGASNTQPATPVGSVQMQYGVPMVGHYVTWQQVAKLFLFLVLVNVAAMWVTSKILK